MEQNVKTRKQQAQETKQRIFDVTLQLIRERGITGVSFFGAFPLQCGFVRRGRYDLLRESLADPDAWLRIIREGGTTTFEGWGRDTKWNTSLFHLTLSDAALFLSDVDLKRLFE